ncbi:MAG: LysM peptidoglycan-binding domain-containing protein [Planctomycetota bacterium]|nr:LysM peptidoglycan-binding domain-containing protein [Planctomycetota bacterium]
MHRDHKVGLAFGILLIGTVAALFFRNETQQDYVIPELENAAELDEEIRTLPRHPEVELDPRIQTVTEGDAVAHGFNEMFPPLDQQGFGTPPPQPIPPPGVSGEGTPPPISFEGTVQSMEPVSLDHESTDSGLKYEVRMGDTLSGLSIRFLGNASRFHEIYNLNRDVMSGPDALKPGIMLRIPMRNSTSIPANVAERIQPKVHQPLRSTPVSTNTNQPVPTSTSSLTNRQALESAIATEHQKSSPQPFTSSDPPISRPSSADAPASGARFVPYGRSPLGFGGPFAESNDDFRAPPPPTKLKSQPATGDLPVHLDPIEIPEFLDESPRRRSSTTPSGAAASGASTPPLTGRANGSTTRLPATRQYQIRSGDKLERLAIKYYGTRNAVQKIIDANPHQLRDPHRLQVGTTIILP